MPVNLEEMLVIKDFLVLFWISGLYLTESESGAELKTSESGAELTVF